jgi:energy-coupling factor transport system permease protein
MKGQFHAFHPVVNFSYYMGAIALVMINQHPIFLLVALSILITFHFFNDRFIQVKQWLFFMFTTGMLIFLINPLFNERGRHALLVVMGHRVTLEATTYGLMSALSIICVLMLFISYNEVMTPNKLLFLFSKFLPQFAILLMLTLRFIPLMRRRLNEIAAVQVSKGISIKQGPWKERIKKGMLYVQVLLTYSLEEAIQTADSMKARGYGQKKRSTYEYFRLNKKDILTLLFFITLLSISLYGRYTGLGTLTIYPLMETVGLAPVENFILFVYALFLCFPLCVEIGEVIRWHLLN